MKNNVSIEIKIKYKAIVPVIKCNCHNENCEFKCCAIR